MAIKKTKSGLVADEVVAPAIEVAGATPEKTPVCEDCVIPVPMCKFTGKCYEGKKILRQNLSVYGAYAEFLCTDGCTYKIPRAEYEAL